MNVFFMQQVTKSKAKQLRDGPWRKASTNKVPQGADTRPLHTYLDRRQATVAHWGDLRPIFDVCTRETSCEVGWKLQVPWRRQAAAEKQLKVTVEEILGGAMEKWRRESGGCGDIEGGAKGRGGY